VAFDHGPTNTITADMFAELRSSHGCIPVGLGASSRSAPGPSRAAGRWRLPRLVGRCRALEILLVGDDIDAALAERYGYVNRVVPDAELEHETDRVARRLADKQAIAETPSSTRPPFPATTSCRPVSARSSPRARGPRLRHGVAALAAHGFGSDTQLERLPGELVALAAPPHRTPDRGTRSRPRQTAGPAIAGPAVRGGAAQRSRSYTTLAVTGAGEPAEVDA
jgi:hypothetical protein